MRKILTIIERCVDCTNYGSDFKTKETWCDLTDKDVEDFEIISKDCPLETYEEKK